MPKIVPWDPCIFLLGNPYDPRTNYSPQDESTAEVLGAKAVPVPNLGFSPHFLLDPDMLVAFCGSSYALVFARTAASSFWKLIVLTWADELLTFTRKQARLEKV